MQKNERGRQNNFFGTCNKCRTAYSCCHDTTPPITRDRREIIERYLEEKRICIADPFVKTEYVFPKLNPDGYCIFQDHKTRKCVIHSVKPETCVTGPITFDINAKTGKIEWYMKMETLCHLAGVVYENKGLLKKHLASAKKEIRRLVEELDAEDLRAILKKQEPETFKIDEEAADKKVLNKLTA
jgi:Fe-S-cluster containining protein